MWIKSALKAVTLSTNSRFLSMQRQTSLVPVLLVSAILLVLHQDYWLWSNSTLVFGFLPAGLFWHLGVSLVAVISWGMVSQFYWPFDDDSLLTEVGEQGEETRSQESKSDGGAQS